MPRGGARPNSGPKAKPKQPDVKDKTFAARVLDRIGKEGWQITDLSQVKSAEDYAIWLLSGKGGGDMFDTLLNRRDGLPVRTVVHVHKEPIQHEVTVSYFEVIERARKRATEKA